MPTFHTLDEAMKDFDEKFVVDGMHDGIKSGYIYWADDKPSSPNDIKSFLSLVWQAAQEARNRELVEKVEKLFKDCDDREDRVEITDVLSLINK